MLKWTSFTDTFVLQLAHAEALATHYQKSHSLPIASTAIRPLSIEQLATQETPRSTPTTVIIILSFEGFIPCLDGRRLCGTFPASRQQYAHSRQRRHAATAANVSHEIGSVERYEVNTRRALKVKRDWFWFEKDLFIFSCDLCGKVYRTEFLLKIHKRQDHQVPFGVEELKSAWRKVRVLI